MVLVRYFKRASTASGRFVDPVTRLPMLEWDTGMVQRGRQRQRVDEVNDLAALDSLCRRVCILPDYGRSQDDATPDKFLLNDLLDWAHAGARYNWQPGTQPNLVVA